MHQMATQGPVVAILAAAVLLAFLNCPCEAVSTPKLAWAQRRHILYLKVVIPGLEARSLDVKIQDSRLKLRANSKEGEQYAVDLNFFRRIESRTYIQDIKSNEVAFIIYKFWEWRYWPRLLKDIKDPLKEYVVTDWKRWKDDEQVEDIPKGEDPGWWDEDLAPYKPADFQEDQFDNSVLPLLNDTTFKEFVGSAPMTSVLFFKRSYGRSSTAQSRATYKAYAIVAATMARHGVPLAAVDGSTNVKLMKRMHITTFPTSRVFYEDGSMHAFDPAKTKSSGGLIDYLLRQRDPPCADLNSTEALVQFMRESRRTALGVFDESSLDKQLIFDAVAKEYHSRVEILPVQFAKVQSHVLMELVETATNETQAALVTRLNVTAMPAAWSGIMMVKLGEALRYFNGPWSAKAMSSWVAVNHFNAIEYVTPDNLQAFQRRQLPMMLIVMDQDQDRNQELLAQLRPVAEEHRHELIFVASHFNASLGRQDPWVKELQCQFSGTTFAVLDDFLHDYRYCLETTEHNPLSEERVRGMVAGYFQQVLQPTGMLSEPVPTREENDGPLFKVVTDTLMDTVLLDRDVVIHFYAKFDKEWEDQQDELDKFAEATEDLGTLVVAKMDGSLNQQPPEFPDIGFYPCTWMWPRGSKAAPVRFNSTMVGFTKQTLLQWAQENVRDGFRIEHGDAVPLSGVAPHTKRLGGPKTAAAAHQPSVSMATQQRDEL